MKEIKIKIKLSLLWAIVTFIFIYANFFKLYDPGKSKKVLNNSEFLNDKPDFYIAALILSIPLLMIFWTIFLNNITSSFLNIAFGLIYTIIMILIVCIYWESWESFYIFYAFLVSTITALIIWYAFKLLKQT